MRDEEVGHAQLLLQIGEQIDHLGLGGDVEGADRFVADEELGLQRKRACDGDALALPTRELVGLTLQHVRTQSDLGQEFHRALLSLVPGHRSVNGQRFPDDVGDALPGVERRVRILEHELHRFAVVAQRRPAHRGDVLAVDDDPSARRVDEAEDQPGQRRLTRPGFSHQAQRCSAVDAQADLVNRPDSACRSTEHAAHREISRTDAWKVATEMLDRVEIPHAATATQSNQPVGAGPFVWLTPVSVTTNQEAEGAPLRGSGWLAVQDH